MPLPTPAAGVRLRRPLRLEVGMLDVWAGGEKKDGLEVGVEEEHEVSARHDEDLRERGGAYYTDFVSSSVSLTSFHS